MQKLVIGMNTSRGFTLIEILIVLVIIGITVGFALISFGDFGESKKILFAAEQLKNMLGVAQQQAILESSTLGLKIDSKSYQILKLQNLNQWRPISNKGIFKPYYFPPNTLINLKINSKNTQSSPTIIINSAGEMTPFTIGFGTNKEKNMTTLQGSHNGNLNFITKKSQ